MEIPLQLNLKNLTLNKAMLPNQKVNQDSFEALGKPDLYRKDIKKFMLSSLPSLSSLPRDHVAIHTAAGYSGTPGAGQIRRSQRFKEPDFFRQNLVRSARSKPGAAFALRLAK